MSNDAVAPDPSGQPAAGAYGNIPGGPTTSDLFPSRADAHNWYDAPTAQEINGEGAPEMDPAHPANQAATDAPADGQTTQDRPQDDRAQDGADPDAPPWGRSEVGAAERITDRLYEDFRAEGLELDGTEVRKLNRLIDTAVRDGQNFQHQGFRDDLLKLHVQQVRAAQQQVLDHQMTVWEGQNNEWRNELRSDPQIGGARLNENLSIARSALETYLPPAQATDLLKAMDFSGMGNNPNMIRFLVEVGKRLNVVEDGMVAANPTSNVNPSAGARGWYNGR